MNTTVNVDVNALLAEIKNQTKATNGWKFVCYITVAYAAYKYAESKDLKKKIEALTDEIKILKTVKGE